MGAAAATKMSATAATASVATTTAATTAECEARRGGRQDKSKCGDAAQQFEFGTDHVLLHGKDI
jgi:hypothetical protein